MDLKERWENAFAPTYGTPRLLLARGKGSRVWDVAGREYLDFIAGLAVCSTGHAHPRVASAIAEQASTLMHVSNLYANEPALRLAERLQQLTGYRKVFLANSGTEANELALKVVARHARATGREFSVLAAEGSFHGRTAGSLSLTRQPKYQEGFPLVSGVRGVPYNDVAALERAFRESPPAGVFLEPVQGEAGVVPATREYLAAARKLCERHAALLVLDEVQTGIGRTGAFLAQSHAGVRADVTTIAKGLGSGFPVAAVLFTDATASLLKPGDHGCTFGGGPLAAAAALATLDIVRDEGLVANAMLVGEHLRESLAKMRGEAAQEVRGMGLLDAVVLAHPGARESRDRSEAAGLLVNAVGDRVLRLAPPLVVTHDEVDEAVRVLETVCKTA